MRYEISAGGVIVRRKGKAWHVLLMCDAKGNWTFPKGIIEDGEDSAKTARREIEEEVGLRDLELLAELQPVGYMYYRDGLIKKTVRYYLFLYQGRQRPKIQKEEGISQAKWVTFKLALGIIGYPKTNHPLLNQAQNLLSTNY